MSITNYIRVDLSRIAFIIVYQSVNNRLLSEPFTLASDLEDVNPTFSVIVQTTYPATSFKYNRKKYPFYRICEADFPFPISLVFKN